MIVSCDESTLYILEAGGTWNCEKFFKFVLGLYTNAVSAFRSSSKDFLDEICNTVLRSELYAMAAKN